MKTKSSVQKNNLVIFPCEYTHVYPNRYTWYICIALMICTRLQEYLYPLISTKIYFKNATRHHFDTHAHTSIVKVYMGPRPCQFESRQIKGLSLKHACTCSTFHFNSLTLFFFFVIVLSSGDIFFKISLFVVVVFLKKYFGNISRVSSSLDPDHA